MSLRRVYETTVIINAALEDDDIETIITKITTYMENHGSIIFEINKWGRRRLAYPINKKFNGYYVHIVYEASPSTIPIFERYLVLEDTVLRHLTVILPKKLREFRAKRVVEYATSGLPPVKEDEKSTENKNADVNSKNDLKAEKVESDVEEISENN
ncbi:MAG: 30S ribosomal protein S6 [Candidatus Kapabacteria bacterium]|nr:30S ribosomal protein S6 [Candidatus Kapabacteria bacterium]